MSIVTVLGEIPAGDVGICLTHEHLLLDLSETFVEPEEGDVKSLCDEPVAIEHLRFLRRRPFGAVRDNVVLDDVPTAVEELRRFQAYGGRTVVDLTSIGMGRRPEGLREIARKAGLNVVMGGGVYLERTHPQWARDASAETLEDVFAQEVIVGVGDTGVRCGILGEIGISAHAASPAIPAEELKVLRAAARTSQKTGVPLAVHFDLRGRAAHTVVDVLLNEGAEPRRILLCHMDQLQETVAYYLSLAEQGVYLGFDSFGREYYSDELGGVWFGADKHRVDLIITLIREGLAERLLLSHDVAFKMDLATYGGYGYGHLLETIIPLLVREGVSDEDIETLLVENPRRLLDF